MITKKKEKENISASQSLPPSELLDMNTSYAPRIIWGVINAHGFSQ